MFVLSIFKDVIRIVPSSFSTDRNKALESEINKKYANKVVYNVGLCIALHDILSINDAVIFPGDGAAHFRVTFRIVVFRPFVGEVLKGLVRSSSREEGIHVTLGFFDDVVISPANLAETTTFDDAKQAWVWKYVDDDGQAHDFDINKDEEICFKVASEKFVDVTPMAQLPSLQATRSPQAQVPYTVEGKIEEFGLGMTSWWSL